MSNISNIYRNKKYATVLIFLIPVLWGLGFTLTHNAVQQMDAGVYAFFRALVACIFLFPFALKAKLKANRQTLAYGAIFGLLFALQFTGHSHALVSLSSATTAFIVSLNAVMIIFVMLFFKNHKTTLTDIIAIGLGILGAYFILNPKFHKLNLGYAWAGLATVAVTLSILVIGHLSNQPKTVGKNNKMTFIFFQSLFCMLFLLYFPATKPIPVFVLNSTWLAVVYMGTFATALTLLMQLYWQHQVGNVRAALIYNLDVVFAGMFGFLNGEHVTLMQGMGGGLIFIASIVHPLHQLAIYKKIKNNYNYAEKN